MSLCAVEQVNHSKDSQGAHICEKSARVRFGQHLLDLDLTWEEGDSEGELRPLFTGASWAGTIVWPASVDLSSYIGEHHAEAIAGAKVIELGAGIGVPGMAARLMKGRVLLTEQAELLELLKANIGSNFRSDGSSDNDIHAMRLDWKSEEDRNEAIAWLGGPADVVLSADCVYEPLYGNSWQALALLLNALIDVPTLALVSLERRTADGIEKFLARLIELGLQWRMVQSTVHPLHSDLPIEIYRLQRVVQHMPST